MYRLTRAVVVRLHEEGAVAPSLTTIHGKTAIRAAIFNHRTDIREIETLVMSVLRIGNELMQSFCDASASNA